VPRILLRTVARIFFSGLLTVLPIVITIYFTLWVLGVLEKFFGKQVMLFIPDDWYRTGMGLAMAIVVVFAVGLMMSDLVFRRLVGWTEWLLLEIPLVRSVYAAMRDLAAGGGGGDRRRALARLRDAHRVRRPAGGHRQGR
jgi:uncharacterized membrane protein